VAFKFKPIRAGFGVDRQRRTPFAIACANGDALRPNSKLRHYPRWAVLAPASGAVLRVKPSGVGAEGSGAGSALKAITIAFQVWIASIQDGIFIPLSREPLFLAACETLGQRRRTRGPVPARENGANSSASGPRSGLWRGTRPRQDRAAVPVRGPPRSQARAHSRSAVPAQGAASPGGRGLIRFAKSLLAIHLSPRCRARARRGRKKKSCGAGEPGV
jgi:hypothetical protein